MSDLAAEIGYAIDALSFQDVIRPTQISAIVLEKIDRDKISPFLVRFGCDLYCRQLARDALRRRFKGNDEGQTELFDLQDRYPRAQHDRDDPEYIKRDLMTKNDVICTLDRLSAEASAKLAHRDALRAWWNERNPSDRC